MEALKKTFTGKRSSSEATEGRPARGEVRGGPAWAGPDQGCPVARSPAGHSRATARRPRRTQPSAASAHRTLRPVPQASTASTSQRTAAEVQQQFKELTLSPAQREGKEPVFEGRVTGGCCAVPAVAGRVGNSMCRVCLQPASA